jgi:hypothetical protein
LRAAPFQTLRVEAAGGAPIEPGIRWGFNGWQDDPSLPRVRTFVTGLSDAELVADYGQSREIQVRTGVTGGQFGVSPGTVSVSPASSDGWVAEGTMATFTAQNVPIDVTSDFELIYRVSGAVSHTLEAATPQEIVLTAENGKAPITWRVLAGQLPAGLALSGGVLRGAALEAGQFPLSLEARDASGLAATGTLTLDVSKPRVGVDALVGVFLLGTPAPSDDQKAYLDHNGNHNGFYDLGDLRVFLLANPTLPATAAQRALVRTLLPMITFGSAGEVRSAP